MISACRVDGMRHPKDMYRPREDGSTELFISDPHDRTTRHDYEPLYQRNEPSILSPLIISAGRSVFAASHP